MVVILIFIEQIIVIFQTQMGRNNGTAAMMAISRKQWMRQILSISKEGEKRDRKQRHETN